MFSFNGASISVIKADYIMKNDVEGRNIFLFLAGNGEEGRYFCRSFFSQNKMDYTKNQASRHRSLVPYLLLR